MNMRRARTVVTMVRMEVSKRKAVLYIMMRFSRLVRVN